MNTGVRTAVIDASQPDRSDAAHSSRSCRYLTPIANLPLIAHVLDGVAGIGIERALIACSPELQDRLTSFVGVGGDRGLTVSYLDTGHAPASVQVAQIRQAAASEPVLVHSADCVFPGQLEHLRDCYEAGDPELVLLVRADGPGAASAGADAPRLAGLALPRRDPEGTAFVLSPSVWPTLERLAPEPLQVQTLVQTLNAEGHRVAAREVDEYWCYCEPVSGERLLVANRMLLDRLPFTPHGLGPGNRAEGRASISPSAQISNSTLRGPIAIGPQAVVENSFVGPYTAIGAGATVIGAELENTMVLAGAEIRYPGSRLESSVIGERALVTQSLGLPTGLHLTLGHGARVVLG